MRITDDIKTCRGGQNANVVMRASAHAIETKRAVEIPGLAWEIEVHLATALPRVASQAIMGLATGANIWFTHFDLQRRNQGRNKLELADGTNIFAEACFAEQGINSKRNQEVVEDQPGGPDWPVP